jgi:hypothetical protein
MGRHPRDLAVLHLEERADAKLVGLALCRRQALVGRQVLALEVELGCRARAVCRGHHHHVRQLLVIAAVHVVEKLGELLLAAAALALAHVMHEAAAQAIEHGGGVLAVEGIVIAGDEFSGGSSSHGRSSCDRSSPAR